MEVLVRKVLAAALTVPILTAAVAMDRAEADSKDEEEELGTIVVTATRTPIRVDEATTSVTVIGRDELEARQAESVFDVLRSVPGVDVVQSGSRGNATTVFLRGAESDQALVMIDGVEVNSVTLSSFDFANLTVENIERIEVMRGAGGTLYGSQAVGGVINIITRRGEGPLGGSFSAAGGNGATQREVVNLGGSFGAAAFSFSGSFFDTAGFQAENDDYRNGTISTRFDYQASPRAAANVIARYTNAKVGLFGNNNFLGGADPNASMDNESLVLKGEWEQEIVHGLEYRLAGSYARDDSTFSDPPDALESGRTESDILSELASGELQVNHYLGDLSVATVGLDYDLRMANVDSTFIDPQFGSFPSSYDKSRWNMAVYLQEQVRLLGGRAQAVGGVRVDNNQDFGSEVSPTASLAATVWRLQASRLRLKASYAEGFKAPSMNELFFPNFGNPNLDAETSREWDFGGELSLLSGRCGFELTYFHRETSDLIEGRASEGGLFTARNVGDVTVDGAEVSATLRLTSWATLRWNYARLGWKTEDDLLLRRPSNRASVNLNLVSRDFVQEGSLASVNVNVDVVGDRQDVDPNRAFAIRTNPAYGRSDIAIAYKLPRTGDAQQGFSVFAKVENLFDTNYQEALGFEGRPINVLAGVTARF